MLSRHRKKFIIAAGIIVVLALAVTLYSYAFRHVSHGSSSSPDYQTVLPGDKTIKDLGGWRRVSPPSSDPVFAYSDTLDGVAISVSEQVIPAAFESNVSSHVADLAKKYNASTVIGIGEVKAYIGTSAKGPQSVIFTKDHLLILIKSQKTISEASWKTYIQTLN